MLKIVEEIFREMNDKIEYCSFKSNEHINKSVEGKTDFDLLVKRECSNNFELILLKKDFKRVNSSFYSTYPGVDNWIGFDHETGTLVHFHVHYQLVTGLEGFKNYVLPWTDIALGSKEFDDTYKIYMVNKEYELIELYSRILLKQDLLKIIKSKLFGFSIKSDNIVEYKWLRERIDTNELESVCKKCFVNIDDDFIISCFKKNNLSRIEYIKLRKIILNYLKLYNRENKKFVYFNNLLLKVKNKLCKSNHHFRITKKTSNKAGLIISFLGVDGSGKSTVSEEISKWLNWKYSVYHISLGIGREKKSSFYKKKESISKTVNISNKEHNNKSQKLRRAIHFLYFSKLINRDIKRLNNIRINGGIVITDRYPQLKYFGISDGPKVDKKYQLLSKLEYNNLKIVDRVQPDIIFKLVAPIEVLTERRPNDNQKVLREKYEILNEIEYSKSKIIKVDSSVSLEEELLFIKRELWKLL